MFTLVVSAINLSKNRKNRTSDLTLDNLNAIAYSETFNWDGKEWNDTDSDHWFGKDWKPVLTTCSVTYGIPPFYSVTVEGHKVTCNNGNGNCLIASDCTNG